jgi:hypothetical protein
MKRRVFRNAVAAVPILLSAGFFAYSQTMPPATPRKDPATLRAHEKHQDLLVAADPWTKEENYKLRFGKKSPFEAGIVAIDVYFHNDGPVPVRVNLELIRLTLAYPGQAEQEIPQMRPEVVADYVYNKSGKDPSKKKAPLPIPGLNSSNSKQVQALIMELKQAQLSTDLVPPAGTVNGLLYFDMNGQFNLVAFSRLYVPDLRLMGSEKPLFFFDVALVPAPLP